MPRTHDNFLKDRTESSWLVIKKCNIYVRIAVMHNSNNIKKDKNEQYFLMLDPTWYNNFNNALPNSRCQNRLRCAFIMALYEKYELAPGLVFLYKNLLNISVIGDKKIKLVVFMKKNQNLKLSRKKIIFC